MRFHAAIKRAVFAIYRLGCVRCDISGLIVYLPHSSRQEFDRSEANVRGAVWILDRFDPLRMRRIRRDLSSGIVVVPGTSSAHYIRDIGVCVLNAKRVLEGTQLSTALSIVHEAAHARMRHLPNNTPERRARMERICIGAEIGFVSRLPDHDSAIEQLQRMQAKMTS